MGGGRSRGLEEQIGRSRSSPRAWKRVRPRITGHAELQALGHEVRLMPAQYVKAYVKRQKNDAADAAAICEAVSRPSMRFVPVKTAEQVRTFAYRRSLAPGTQANVLEPLSSVTQIEVTSPLTGTVTSKNP